MPVQVMGKFTAIGMRTPEKDLPDDAIIINTCGKNDTAEKGDPNSWTWCNPTNRAIQHPYQDIVAVSVECLWQGTKIRQGMTRPDPTVIGGNWRAGKGKRPIGAYAGPNQPLITTPGEARRKIYVPAFRNLALSAIDHEPKAVESFIIPPNPVFGMFSQTISLKQMLGE